MENNTTNKNTKKLLKSLSKTMLAKEAPNYTHSKKTDPLFRKMQNVIDEIENGKYLYKK